MLVQDTQEQSLCPELGQTLLQLLLRSSPQDQAEARTSPGMEPWLLLPSSALPIPVLEWDYFLRKPPAREALSHLTQDRQFKHQSSTLAVPWLTVLRKKGQSEERGGTAAPVPMAARRSIPLPTPAWTAQTCLVWFL